MLFNFAPSLKLRAVTIDGQPWFAAADVCKVLEHSNTTMALKFIDAEDVAKHSLGRDEANFVNEAGLYALLL